MGACDRQNTVPFNPIPPILILAFDSFNILQSLKIAVTQILILALLYSTCDKKKKRYRLADVLAFKKKQT